MPRIFFSAAAGIAFIVWGATFVPPQATRAQTPPASSISPLELIVNWSTNTYVPLGFEGKALPVSQSRVIVSVDAIRNGKLSSLSGQMIRWYVNDRFVNAGIGMQTLALPLGTTAVGSFEVRAELPNIDADVPSKTVVIPITRPYAAIVAPFPDLTVRRLEARVRTLPYFFNARSHNDLLYSWQVNDDMPEASENPDELIISLGNEGGGDVEVSAIVRNPGVQDEVTQTSIDLRFAP